MDFVVVVVIYLNLVSTDRHLMLKAKVKLFVESSLNQLLMCSTCIRVLKIMCKENPTCPAQSYAHNKDNICRARFELAISVLHLDQGFQDY